MQYLSPLRYPGGKARLARYMGQLIEDNGLIGGHYVEPYAGGAGVALALLYLEYSSHVHLNDLNRSVHAFWSACLDHPEEMCRRVADTPLDMDEWRKQREIQRAESPSVLDLGFSTLYMNRTNRSGVIKGGVIGGKEQAGQWKINARFNRKDIASRIEKFASYKSRVTLHGQDALALIKKLSTTTPANTLFYLDPPYYRKAEKLYDNHYKPADHAELAEAVAQLDRPWVVSYDDQPEIRTLYSAFRQEVFGINYSAGPVAKGSEVMIYGPKINASASTVSTWRGIAA